jgi:hypothetical protein
LKATKPKFGKTKELKVAARKMREASAGGAHGVPADSSALNFGLSIRTVIAGSEADIGEL